MEAISYRDAVDTGCARNPKAHLLSANPTYKKDS